eukprot:gene25687-31413_t
MEDARDRIESLEANPPSLPKSLIFVFQERLRFEGGRTFQQRYFVYDKYHTAGGPIFFYAGNEANVELYVNATGLMWENAARFRALLIFAEHRYYGSSQPFGAPKDWREQPLQYLTHDQALADYAALLYRLRAERVLPTTTATIAFGGSYGGMLAAWLRIKYPGSIDGAIAASAPILAFAGESPAFDTNTYWQVVTADASPAKGAAAECIPNIRAAWQVLFAMGATQASLGICEPIMSREQVEAVAMLELNVLDTLAMGNFPYPSNYLVFQQTEDPSLMLPAWPMRAACREMTSEPKVNKQVMDGAVPGTNPTSSGARALLARLRAATNILSNITQSVQCLHLPDPKDVECDGIWDYQYCTEMLPQ